jgi:hypothetical protein
LDRLPGGIDAAAAEYAAERAAPLDARAQKPPRRQQKAPPLSAMNEIKARRNGILEWQRQYRVHTVRD